jgi:uncharacterized protein YbbC (DUF1343 family)
VGAPWIDGARLAKALNALPGLPGVSFLPSRFTPRPIPGKDMKPKYAGTPCGGVRVVITDPARYESLKTGLSVIAAVIKLWPQEFTFRERFFRLLSGTEDMHRRLLKGETPQQILASYAAELAAFRARRKRYLLYP